jgi:hypothetical protein
MLSEVRCIGCRGMTRLVRMVGCSWQRCGLSVQRWAMSPFKSAVDLPQLGCRVFALHDEDAGRRMFAYRVALGEAT